MEQLQPPTGSQDPRIAVLVDAQLVDRLEALGVRRLDFEVALGQLAIREIHWLESLDKSHDEDFFASLKEYRDEETLVRLRTAQNCSSTP